VSLTLLTILIFLVALGLAASAFFFFVAEPATKKKMQGRLAAMLAAGMQLPGGRELKLRRKKASEVPLFDRALAQFKWVKWVQLFIQQAGLQLTATMLLLMSFSLGLVVCLAGLIMDMPGLLLLVTAVGVGAIPFLVINFMRNRRFAKFEELFPDTIDMMARAVRAGHAMTTALELIANEMPEPIATEFRKTYEEQNLGLSLKLALANLVQRMPILDLRMCVTAVLIQRETGGNLAELLEKVALTIRERFRIMEDLKTMTLSSRWSAWLLCALPIFLAIYISVANPGYMDVLYLDPRGHKLIAAAAIMQVLGMLMVKRIMKIRI